VPSGFHVSMVATNVPGARFMAFAPNGDLLVSETGSGDVVKVDPNGSAGQSAVTVANGLPRPHGLAFHGNDLYIATWAGVSVLRVPVRSMSGVPASASSAVPCCDTAGSSTPGRRYRSSSPRPRRRRLASTPV